MGKRGEHKQTLLMTSALACSIALLAGCAAQKTDTVPEAPAVSRTGGTRDGNEWVDGSSPTAPGGGGAGTGGTTGNPYSAGSTVDLLGSVATLREFFLPPLRPYYGPSMYPNNPINININIDMSVTSDPVIIGFDESGTGGGRERAFGTRHPDTNVTDAGFNGWYTINGQRYYKGFFQDRYGAILLIVNGASSTGVGDGLPGSVTGEVWYQHFADGNPVQGPQKMCWRITAGNHDCRTFLSGSNINMGGSLFPDFGNRGPNMPWGYTKLGTFRGLDRTKANFPN